MDEGAHFPMPAERVKRPSWPDFLFPAIWFGLVTGLGEGLWHLAFQQLGWVSWDEARMGVTLPIVWIAALVSLVAFVGVGAAMWIFSRLARSLPVLRAAIFLFVSLLFFDWISLSGRIQHYGTAALGAGLGTLFLQWFNRNAAARLRFFRTSLPWVVGALGMALVGIEGGMGLAESLRIARLPEAAPNSPNVLLVVLDTVRADHLSAYGYPRTTSPTLNQLAREGVLFEKAYAASSWSPPSHASLVTGRYLHDHLTEWDRALDKRFPTLGEALAARGYRTGAFSGNTEWFAPNHGFGRGFAHFDVYYYNLGDVLGRTFLGRLLPYRVTLHLAGFHKWSYYVNREMLHWIDRGAQRPFFAMLNYFDCHSPYMPPPPFRNRFTTRPRTWFAIDHAWKNYSNLSPAQLQEEIAGYDGAIAHADFQLGVLLAELRKRGLTENTLIIVTADHGESFGEHGVFAHTNGLHREVIQVPLVLCWPGHVPSAVRVSQPVTNAAIAATIFDLLGIGEQGLFPGPPLDQLWKNPSKGADWPYPLAEIAQQPFPRMRRLPVYSGEMKSLVGSRWQYIVHEKQGEELYDLWDPKARESIAQTPEGQILLREFHARLQEMLGRPARAASRRQ